MRKQDVHSAISSSPLLLPFLLRIILFLISLNSKLLGKFRLEVPLVFYYLFFSFPTSLFCLFWVCVDDVLDHVERLEYNWRSEYDNDARDEQDSRLVELHHLSSK